MHKISLISISNRSPSIKLPRMLFLQHHIILFFQIRNVLTLLVLVMFESFLLWKYDFVVFMDDCHSLCSVLTVWHFWLTEKVLGWQSGDSLINGTLAAKWWNTADSWCLCGVFLVSTEFRWVDCAELNFSNAKIFVV